MSKPSRSPSGGAAIPIVEDLFVTDAFLIKGRLANKYQRLTKMLEDSERTFLRILDATMVSLRGSEVIRTPSVYVNRAEIILAHELVDTASDDRLRQLAANEKTVRVRCFYSGAIQLELAGQIEAGAYESTHNAGRWYFVLQSPMIRGLHLDESRGLGVLKSLPYAIVRKSKLSYIYDFS